MAAVKVFLARVGLAIFFAQRSFGIIWLFHCLLSSTSFSSAWFSCFWAFGGLNHLLHSLAYSHDDLRVFRMNGMSFGWMIYELCLLILWS